MKRYDISLLPKNFFTGGSFCKKKRGVGGVGKGGRRWGEGGGEREGGGRSEGGIGGGRGGGEIKKK